MIALVLGGARSGKSAYAERRAAPRARVVRGHRLRRRRRRPRRTAEEHRARRPESWTTIEAGPDLPEVLRTTRATVVLDALGPWIATAPDFDIDGAELCDALAARDGDTIVVSEEVGLGVHPSTAAGQRFRDVLGELNQAVAAVADEVVLVVAGRALRLEPAG